MKKALLNKLLYCLGAVAIGSTVLPASSTALQISQSRSEQDLQCVELKDAQFELSFIHSVSLTPVIDKYQILETYNGFKIRQTEEVFLAHGQGLPSLTQEPDALSFELINGSFVLKMNREISNLIVRTDARFENKLRTGSKNINLNKWPDTGLRITPITSCH